MNLAEAIKKCSMDAFDASVPCEVVLGYVESAEPLKVTIGDLKIPEEILYVSEHLLYREQEIRMGTYERVVVICEGICEGDTLVLMRKSGGGMYVAVGKI